jgi:hypothetical protein
VRLVQSADPNTAGSDKLTVELCLFNGTVDEKVSCWKSAEGKTGALLQTIEVEILNGQQTKEKMFQTAPALVDAVQEAIKAGTRLNLLAKLKDESFAGRRLLMFRGNEYATAVSRPSLIILYTPVITVGSVEGIELLAQTIVAAR